MLDLFVTDTECGNADPLFEGHQKIEERDLNGTCYDGCQKGKRGPKREPAALILPRSLDSLLAPDLACESTAKRNRHHFPSPP
jgi:hypothetical protein